METSMTFSLKGLGGALALVLGSVGLAGAQAPARPVSITFEQAISIALKQNTSLKQAENASDLSAATVQQAKMQFLPDLRFNVSNGLDVGRNFNQTEGRIVDQTSRSLQTGVSSGVTLFDGFKNVSTLNAAKASEAASTHDITRTKQTVVFTVA